MRYFDTSIVVSRVVVSLFFISFLIFPYLSFAVDLSKEIAALKEEIKTAQAKIDRAKAGETLEKITIPVSIKNMQKILGSLSQKVSGDQNLSGKVRNLNSSLNSLERAKTRNDKSGAQKILNDMAGAVKGLETGLPPAAKAEERVDSRVPKEIGISKAQLPSPSLEIAFFNKCLDPMVIEKTIGKTTTSRATEILVNRGENFCLSWKIVGCNLENIRAELNDRPIDPGRRVDTGRGCFSMENHSSYRIERDTYFTLAVSGFYTVREPPMQVSARKEFLVNVRQPRLRVRGVCGGFKCEGMRVSIENYGEADFEPRPLIFGYAFGKKSGQTFYREEIGEITVTPSQTIKRGEQYVMPGVLLPTGINNMFSDFIGCREAMREEDAHFYFDLDYRGYRPTAETGAFSVNLISHTYCQFY